VALFGDNGNKQKRPQEPEHRGSIGGTFAGSAPESGLGFYGHRSGDTTGKSVGFAMSWWLCSGGSLLRGAGECMGKGGQLHAEQNRKVQSLIAECRRRKTCGIYSAPLYIMKLAQSVGLTKNVVDQVGVGSIFS